jgi:DNA-directed RNA polymerase subunit F
MERNIDLEKIIAKIERQWAYAKMVIYQEPSAADQLFEEMISNLGAARAKLAPNRKGGT